MRRSRPLRLSLSAGLLVGIVAILLTSLPVPASATPVLAAPQPEAGTTAYVVTWNGQDVSTATGVSSAISLNLAQTATVIYSWSGSALVNISDARLQMFYFGFAVSTRDQVLTNPLARTHGNISLSWAPLSVDYLLEGVYRLTASFLAPNGTTMWSENFYLRGTAPLGFVALIPIVLLLILIYEVYALVRSGRYAVLGRKPEAMPPTGPSGPAPPSGTGPSGPTSPSETGPSSTPPPQTPPPSGGGS